MICCFKGATSKPHLIERTKYIPQKSSLAYFMAGSLIRKGFSADSDPDPGSQTNADPDPDPGKTLPSQKVRF